MIDPIGKEEMTHKSVIILLRSIYVKGQFDGVAGKTDLQWEDAITKDLQEAVVPSESELLKVGCDMCDKYGYTECDRKHEGCRVIAKQIRQMLLEKWRVR